MRNSSVLLITAALLGACSQSPTPTTAAAPGGPTSGAYVLTVRLPDAALSDAALEAQYGAHLVVRTPGFALLTTDTRPGLLAQAGRPNATTETNRRVMRTPVLAQGTVNLWGSGTVALWGSGTVALWGSGTVALWGSGNQAPVANEATWNALGLGQAHTRLAAGGTP
ncbi:MAG: hypothetical protein JWQ08_789, partial [Deinococcus sp.]|nr:hypothetical protein [Deinococcus sp.]